MIESVQFSVASRTRALCSVVLATVWLLSGVSPLTGQQYPAEAARAAGADEQTASVVQDYSGPAVLSRGNQPALIGGQHDTVEPFLSLNSIYGTGLSGGLSTNAPNPLQAGIELGLGLKGTHRWKQMTLQIEYQGSYRDYTVHTPSNGLNQFLSATAVLQLRRHLVLSIRQTGGILTQDAGTLLFQPAFLESASTLPTNEPFSTGLKFSDSVTTLTYRMTRRLSFSGSIEGTFLRQSTPDVGTNSVILSADAAYRLSSRAAIGLDYSFSHFNYTTFGSTDVDNAAVEYSWRATKSVDVVFQVGMAHSDTVALVLVPIDPAIAAIVGTATGIQVSYRSINIPVMNAQVTKRWRRSSADLNYGRGLSSGNGLVLASKQDSMSAGLHYSNGTRWTISLQAGRTTMAEIDAAGSYTGNTIAASFNRLIRPGLQAVARFDVRPVNYIGLQSVNRTFYRGEIGFIFSGSQIPIALR